MPLATQKNSRGVTLLELVLAVAFATTTIFYLLLTFPKATKSFHSGRTRVEATYLASSKVEELRSIPFPLLALTPTSLNYFSSIAQNPLQNECDCSTAYFQNFGAVAASGPTPAAQDTFTSPSGVYTRTFCIDQVHRVGNSVGYWRTSCQGIPTGSKRIVVHIAWNDGNQPQSLNMESIVSQY